MLIISKNASDIFQMSICLRVFKCRNHDTTIILFSGLDVCIHCK